MTTPHDAPSSAMHPGRWRISVPKVVFGPRHRWWVMAAAMVLTVWVAWFATSTPRAVDIECTGADCAVVEQRFGKTVSTVSSAAEACQRMRQIFGKRSTYSRQACRTLDGRTTSSPPFATSYDTGTVAWGLALLLLLALPLGSWAYAMRTVSVAVVGDTAEIRRRVFGFSRSLDAVALDDIQGLAVDGDLPTLSLQLHSDTRVLFRGHLRDVDVQKLAQLLRVEPP